MRAYARPASRPAQAWSRGRSRPEVGVRHVERHSRLWSPNELAALHAPLDATARGTPMYGTPAACRANSRQMTRPSRRRSEETMKERASSCVRAPPCRATVAPIQDLESYGTSLAHAHAHNHTSNCSWETTLLPRIHNGAHVAPVYFTVFVLSALGSLSFYILLSGVALQDDLFCSLPLLFPLSPIFFLPSSFARQNVNAGMA